MTGKRPLLAFAAAFGMLVPSAPAVAADDGIPQSRSMSVKDRVEAADTPARYYPKQAIPLLVEALNDVSLGANPERRMNGQTLLDYAKVACPPEVQQALLGRAPWRDLRRSRDRALRSPRRRAGASPRGGSRRAARRSSR